MHVAAGHEERGSIREKNVRRYSRFEKLHSNCCKRLTTAASTFLEQVYNLDLLHSCPLLGRLRDVVLLARGGPSDVLLLHGLLDSLHHLRRVLGDVTIGNFEQGRRCPYRSSLSQAI